MVKFFLALLFTTISLSLLGQKLKITNKDNLPVADVFIYHDNRAFTTFTNKNGEADLTNFPKKRFIHLQHPSFENTDIHMDSLAKDGYQLKLKESLIWFNELIIAANKWEQSEKDLSQTIMAVNRKEIAFDNPTTSADLLSQSGQVFVQKSQLGGGSPKLRGFSANSVLMVVDGVRMNNAIYRSGNLQNVINIDPNALSNSEVVFGPGSVIYGSDALGGVMDFHTIDPNWSPSGSNSDVNILTRYSTAAEEQTIHADWSYSRKKWALFSSATKTIMSDLRAGSNRNDDYKGYFFRPNYAVRKNGEDILMTNNDPNTQVGTAYELFSTVQKLKMMTGKNADLTYGFYYSTTSDIPRYDRLIVQTGNTDSLEYGDWFYGPQTWQMHSIRYNNYQKTKMFDQSRLTVAYQDYKESRNDRDFGNDRIRTRTELVDMYSANLDFDKSLEKGQLFYGIEYTFNDVTSEAFRQDLSTGIMTPTSTRYPDGGSTFMTAASYVNWIYYLKPKWTLNMGSRFSYVQLKAQTNNTNLSLIDFDNINLKNQAINGMAGIIHLPNEKTKISYTISSGFRAPNIDDVGKIFEFDNDENGQPIIVVPNAKLKPEYSYNQELSLSKKIGKLTFSSVVFYTILTNPIVRGPYEINGISTIDLDEDNDALTPDETHGIRAQINGDGAQIYGASLQMKLEFTKNFESYGTLSFSDGKETKTDEPLRHTTPFFGKVGLKYQTEKWRNEFYVDFNGNRWRNNIPSSEIDDKPYLYTDKGSPGWYTLNAKSSVQISEFLSANGGIENIMDTHYRPYSSGLSAPGRNFILSLRGTF